METIGCYKRVHGAAAVGVRRAVLCRFPGALSRSLRRRSRPNSKKLLG